MGAKIKTRIRKDGGYYLRILRAEQDWKQTDAADYFGVTPSHWSLLEDGKRNASPQLAAELSRLTGAPIEVFLGVDVPR